MLLVGTIHFEEGTALAERVHAVGQGEVGGCHQCMVAVAASYRESLVSAGWAVFFFLAQMSIENGPFTL